MDFNANWARYERVEFLLKRVVTAMESYAFSLKAVIFISIFLGSSSCDFQWSDRAIYIHEFG
jgi:hypothetical protein